MSILPSQHLELTAIAKATSLGGDVAPDNAEGTVWRYKPERYRYAIVIREDKRKQWGAGSGWTEVRGYSVAMTPGVERHDETDWVPEWEDVKKHFATWLGNLERERRARELSEESGEMPDWVSKYLPMRIAEIREQIGDLRREARELNKAIGLLWQTGQPLNEAVRDSFVKLGFSAELTPPAETYDVTVNLGQGRRLLIEVTGIDDSVHKRSNKIAQVLQVSTKLAGAQDRVVLAVNAHRRRSPEDRARLEIVTSDAADLLVGMKAVIVTTITLHAIVTLFQSNPEAAKELVEQLFVAQPGIYAFPKATQEE